jgi:hypothetical protein
LDLETNLDSHAGGGIILKKVSKFHHLFNRGVVALLAQCQGGPPPDTDYIRWRMRRFFVFSRIVIGRDLKF